MLWPLLRKLLHDAKWLLLACSAAEFAFCWLRVWIVSRVDTERFKAIIDLLPGDWQRFTPVDFGWLVTYEGRIALAYDELIVVLCLSIWAIARGSDCISGEIGRGTMEMLLAQPFSRGRFLLLHTTVTIVGVATIALSAWLGNWAGIQTTLVEEQVAKRLELPFRVPGIRSDLPLPEIISAPETKLTPMTEKIDAAVLLPATANLFCLGFMLVGVTTLISASDRYRWRTIGIVVALYVAQIMVKLAGMASEQWEWLLYFSIFTAYEPEFMVRIADTLPNSNWAWQIGGSGETRWGPLAYHGILVAVGTVSFCMAATIFRRRDIPAPL